MGDDLTYEQLLAMLKGQYADSVGEGGVMSRVGARGLDTPAERDFLQGGDSDNGVMDLATNYKNTNATQADYDTKMSYIDSAPALGGLDKMRALQNIDSSNLGLGGGVRGFDTPAAREGAIAETEFLENSFAGTGEANMDVDRASFNTNFANLTPEEQANVTQLMANMTPEQKKAFALGMTGKEGAGRLGGYEVGEQNRLAY